ncbi:MAG: hypothetical protein U5L04_09150 [Trueperaceae bacterium]|nr:hypothetical protein [Trueperaceae bacterium]
MPTLVAVFESPDKAERALSCLYEQAFADEEVEIAEPPDTLTTGAEASTKPLSDHALPDVQRQISPLALSETVLNTVGADLGDEEAEYYRRRLRGGARFVIVRADDDRVALAAEVLGGLEPLQLTRHD